MEAGDLTRTLADENDKWFDFDLNSATRQVDISERFYESVSKADCDEARPSD